MSIGTVALQPMAEMPGVWRVRIHHVGRMNAMTRAMWVQLRAVFEQLAGDVTARCIVVEGEGGVFCAGGDISEYPAFRFDPQTLRAFHEGDVWGALAAMRDCDVPVVALIEGPCMGAGVEIASCCDIRMASKNARFGAPIARLGFPMAPREAQLVARAVGDSVARRMLLEGAVLDAADMHACGFLAEVAPPNALRERCAMRAAKIAALAPQAARLNKRTLRALSGDLADTGLGDRPAMDALVRQAYDYADSAEHHEGIAAFMEKRPPVF